MNKKNKNSVRKSTMKYFWGIIRRYKWYSIGLVAITPIVIFIRSTLSPLIFASMINKISAGIPNDKYLEVLGPEALLFLVLYLFNIAVLSEYRLYLTWKISLLAWRDLADDIFDTISEQSMQFHSDRFSGSLVSQTNKYLTAFDTFVDLVIWTILPFLSSFIAIIAVLYPIVPWYAIALSCFVLIYIIIIGFTQRKVTELNEKEASTYSLQNGQMSDSFSNILAIKSYGQEKYEKKRFSKYTAKSYNSSVDLLWAIIKRDLAFTIINTFVMVLVLILLIFGTTWLNLSIGSLILVVTYSQQIAHSLWDVNRTFRGLSRVFGDAYEMTLILDQKNTVTDLADAKKLSVEKGEIEFENITFSHHDAKEPIFADFSLKIKAGEKIGIVGLSGSGKTTITKLLLRFADLAKGKILIDGQNIAEVSQTSLRKQIAYVPQETALFHRSIAENIAYAKPNATTDEIIKAAKLANADQFILNLDHQYQTKVGERGTKLSGGQRQRIAIARAILKDAPILILDEATSALDSESEMLIKEAMEELMKDRTSLVIAHRLSTVANLDRIIVLNDGEIIEQGSHKELLALKGAYAKLWAKQSA